MLIEIKRGLMSPEVVSSRTATMAEEKLHLRPEIPPKYDPDAKWDACLDLAIRRSFHATAAGAFAGLLLFRSPVSRWASVAFGAGVGIGRSYTECSYVFDGSPPKWPARIGIDKAASSQEEDK